MKLAPFAALILVLTSNPVAAERQVAITIDDLPRGGDGADRSLPAVLEMTRKLLAPFREQEIPVIGFVNEGRRVDFGPDGLGDVLDVWLDAGAELGNHSYSHLDINSVSIDTYTADIVRGEAILAEKLAERGIDAMYFRHPFLRTGPTLEKKLELESFLGERGYRVAPVTLDNEDYLYAALYTQPEFTERMRNGYISYMESVVEFFEAQSIELAGREFPQILLLHANQLNADLMPQLLKMFRSRGYEFVSLNEALKDPVYGLADDYVGPRGISWIQRWLLSEGATPESEPRPPAWMYEAFEER